MNLSNTNLPLIQSQEKFKIISDFSPSAVTDNMLKIDAKPDSNDITSARDYIVRIQEADITLNITDITSSTSLTTALSSGTTTGGSTVSY